MSKVPEYDDSKEVLSTDVTVEPVDDALAARHLFKYQDGERLKRKTDLRLLSILACCYLLKNIDQSLVSVSWHTPYAPLISVRPDHQQGQTKQYPRAARHDVGSVRLCEYGVYRVFHHCRDPFQLDDQVGHAEGELVGLVGFVALS